MEVLTLAVGPNPYADTIYEASEKIKYICVLSQQMPARQGHRHAITQLYERIRGESD